MNRFLLIGLIILTNTATATIINIPADYPTIQQGIDASTDGDTVLVQPGVYSENISIIDENIVLASNYIISSDTLDIVNTIIDGDSLTPPVVNIQNSADSARIIGFTIKNCTTNNYSEYAVIMINASFEHNIIENNKVQVIWASYSEIKDNIFRSNDSTTVLEIMNYVNISGNIFHNNYSSVLMFVLGYYSNIESNFIYDNEGLIFWCFLAGPSTIRKNLIYDNYYGWGVDGGGIFHTEDSEILADGNVIYNNSGSISSYLGTFGIRVSGAPAIFTNNIIWHNFYPNPDSSLFCEYYFCVDPTITYSDVQGGWPGEGNIECDPQFCDPGSGNFYLHYNSCCVAAGQNGENMGVYGVGCWSTCSTYVVGDVNGSGVYDGLDIMYGVAFLKGGPTPTVQCECTEGNILYPAGDVNNSCSYNGLDITYGVAYFKGGSGPMPCQDCPPDD